MPGEQRPNIRLDVVRQKASAARCTQSEEEIIRVARAGRG